VKIQPVDGRGHDMHPCVTRGSNTSCGINQFHNVTAVDIPRRIGVFRIHGLRYYDPAFTYFFPFHWTPRILQLMLRIS
jgi:hypothetical protein